MAALLEEDLLQNAPLRTGAFPDLPASDVTDGLYGNAAQPVNHGAMAQHSRTGEAIKSAMPELVKGFGLARKGGNQPLEDPRQIAVLASQAAVGLRSEVRRGYVAKSDVVKGISGDFMNQFGALRTALTTPSIGEQITQLFQSIPGGAEALAKSFTAGNLGVGSVYGFVPFDLLAP